jgi:cell division septation protein DedD
MVRKNGEERGETRRTRGAALLRLVYGAGLVALGTCLGIVIGSLSETPRLVLERLRGPVETVEIASPEPETRTREAAESPLERFGELQEGKSPKSEKALPAKAVSAAEAEPPPPLVPLSELATAPPVAAAPPIAPSPALAPAAVEVRTAVQPQGAVVQVASYVERKPADELVVKLKDSGFDAYVSQPAAANGRYRVRIRPTAKESAGDLAKRLRGFGFDTWATSE